MFVFWGILLLALCPMLGMAGSCSNPTGLESWSATYGTTISSDIVVTKALLVDVSFTAQGITLGQGGSLYFDRTKSISIAINWMLIGSGAGMYIGSEDCPYTQKAIVTLKGEGVASSMYGANFIGVAAGGVLELHGSKGLGQAWTKLTQTAAAGATSIQVLETITGLQAGDKLVIATTDYSPVQNEVVTITSISGTKINFVPALQWSHYGAVTMDVDQRAEVGLLTRSILIQGLQRNNFIGGHLMATRGFSQVHIEGVEFDNMGQDELARYPVHFHLCGDVTPGTYVRYNSIHDTNFRCVTIHATNGVLVEGNVAYNNYGHCYFMEDGVEVNNVIRGNLAILTKPKDFGQRLGSDNTNTGVSSFWITNPQNIIEDNAAAGSYTAGFWIITHLGARGVAACLPQYQNLPYRIANLKLQSFKGNSAHSCAFGLGIESTNWGGDIPAAPCGGLVANWEPREADGSLAWTRFEDFTAHHIRDRGVWARMPNIIVVGGRFADNYESVEYATSGDHPSYASEQVIQDSIIVGFSENKGNREANQIWQGWDNVLQQTVPPQGTPMNGIKIYDGPQVIINTVFRNFPAVPGRPLDAPIGARVADQAQVATTNYLKNVQFIDCAYRFRVIDDTMDGGITANFRDVDGSVTGYTGSTALRAFPFYKTPECKESSSYMMTCPHKYSQLWVLDMTNNGNNNNMYITRAHAGANHADYTLKFQGFNAGPLFRYQPIVSIGANYLVRFQAHVPSSLALQLNNAEVGESVGVAICYPLGTVITSVQRGYANYDGNAWPMNMPQSRVTTIPATGALGSNSDAYVYDAARGILYVNVQQRNSRSVYGNFCPQEGCDWVWVNAQFNGPMGAAGRDCTQDAYNSGFLTENGGWLAKKLVATSFVPNVIGSLLGGLSGTPKPSTPSTPSTPTVSATTAPTVSATTAPTTTTTTTTTTTVSASNNQCRVSCPANMGCCGDACFDSNQYQCNNGKLCSKGLSSCGNICYPAAQFTCVNGVSLAAR